MIMSTAFHRPSPVYQSPPWTPLPETPSGRLQRRLRRRNLLTREGSTLTQPFFGLDNGVHHRFFGRLLPRRPSAFSMWQEDRLQH
jgi:hypothetical protein